MKKGMTHFKMADVFKGVLSTLIILLGKVMFFMFGSAGGCPLCGGWEGYHGGATGAPCDVCQAGYQRALKNLPEGTSIITWYGAKSAAEEILASGGTEAAAQDKMREIIATTVEKRQDIR